MLVFAKNRSTIYKDTDIQMSQKSRSNDGRRDVQLSHVGQAITPEIVVVLFFFCTVKRGAFDHEGKRDTCNYYNSYNKQHGFLFVVGYAVQRIFDNKKSDKIRNRYFRKNPLCPIKVTPNCDSFNRYLSNSAHNNVSP